MMSVLVSVMQAASLHIEGAGRCNIQVDTIDIDTIDIDTSNDVIIGHCNAGCIIAHLKAQVDTISTSIRVWMSILISVIQAQGSML